MRIMIITHIKKKTRGKNIYAFILQYLSFNNMILWEIAIVYCKTKKDVFAVLIYQ